MRTLAGVVLAIGLAAGAYAQTFGSASGFGNVVFPGTGHAPRNPNVSGFGNVVFPGTARAPRPVGAITDPSFAARLGATVNGTGTLRLDGRSGRARGPVYVPYAYPVYVGGGGYYDQPEQQQPNVMVVYPQQQPPVVINQSFAAPQAAAPQEPAEIAPAGIQAYQAPMSQRDNAVPEASSYYLIAFKDNSIYSAVAYWVDGDTLHYFTSGNTHNQVSMSLVDRTLTERLNRERKVEIRLPGSR